MSSRLRPESGPDVESRPALIFIPHISLFLTLQSNRVATADPARQICIFFGHYAPVRKVIG